MWRKAQWPKPSPTPWRHTVTPRQRPGGRPHAHKREMALAVRLRVREQEAQKRRPVHSLALRFPHCPRFYVQAVVVPLSRPGSHLRPHMLCLGSPVHSRPTAQHVRLTGSDATRKHGKGEAATESRTTAHLFLGLPVLLPAQQRPVGDLELGSAHEPKVQVRFSGMSKTTVPTPRSRAMSTLQATLATF